MKARGFGVVIAIALGVTGYGSYRIVAVCSYSQCSVCDCRRSCMVVLCVRETCAVRLVLAVRRCCYYCASVCVIMSNTYTVEKKSETKSNQQHLPTVRIQAELFEPTENRYPVFNYQKLLLIEEVSDRIEIHTLYIIHLYVRVRARVCVCVYVCVCECVRASVFGYMCM